MVIFFTTGLLYLLRPERVDNLGAYRIPPETGLLIPSEVDLDHKAAAAATLWFGRGASKSFLCLTKPGASVTIRHGSTGIMAAQIPPVNAPNLAVLYFRQLAMRTLLLRLLTLPLVMTVLAGAATTFHSSQTKISYGDSCTLTWSSGGNEAYIVGVGKVEGSGSVQVAPQVATDYVLVVNTGKRVEYSTLHVEVEGLKGNEEYPDQDKFQTGLRDQRKATYPDFLDKVTKTLQSRPFAYHVRGSYLPPDRFILIYTNWVVQHKLMLPGDKGIRQRQVAYAVNVNEPVNGVITFDIRSLVQYQRMGESLWRDDKDPEVNRMAEQMLQESLSK